MVHMNNAMTGIYVATYFWVISKDWVWLETFAASMTLAVILCSLILPESPKFYLSKNRWDDARRSFSTIARFNGAGPFTATFEDERKNQETAY
jgi:hypothetical protein